MAGALWGVVLVFGAFLVVNWVQGILRGSAVGEENVCELVAPPEGFAGLGYACLDTSGTGFDPARYACQPESVPGYCPGPANIQCCIQKEDES
jgi:hypothetical protein